jgi:hypothetical protein
VALTSAANVAAMAPNLTASEAVLSALIARADVALARFCGYPPASAGAAPSLESASYTLYSGTPSLRVISGRVLEIDPYPVTAIASIQRGDHGERIVLKVDAVHGGWSRNNRAVRVICTAGFSSVPADLETAAIEMVLHLLDLRDRRGVSTASTPDGLNTAYRDETVPAHVAQLLEPYRLPGSYIP